MLRGCLDGVGLLLQDRRRLPLRLTSEKCKGSVPRQAVSHQDGVWHGFCPCCKRPVEICVQRPQASRDAPSSSSSRAAAGHKGAFVCVLWGLTPEYCLGAMVLGKSLQLVGTKYDLVALHTDDVPEAALELLTRSGWKPRLVDPIAGVGALYNHGEPRFQGVFTKLRALGLVEYKKVVLLDIDMLVRHNIDDLLDLPAPAAMARGPGSGYKHGKRINGRNFFRGANGSYTSWGQAWGINAGVMVWEPNAVELEQMLVEVLDPKHPSHIKGNGPEQDYVSRFWAHSWSHIGVEYNFQLHQMYYALHPDYLDDPSFVDRTRFFFEEPVGAGIRVMHYSGHLKPWSRVLDPEWKCQTGPDSQRAFSQAVVDSFPGYWLWIQKNPEMWAKRQPLHDLVLGPDGEIHRLGWSWAGGKSGGGAWSAGKASDAKDEGFAEAVAEIAALKAPADTSSQRAPAWGQGGGSEWTLGEVVEVSPKAISASRSIVDNSLTEWLQVYTQLQADFGTPDLAQLVHEAYSPPANAGDLVPNDEPAYSPPAAKPEWVNHGGWWFESPLDGRASALAGCIPEPFVALSIGGKVLLDLHGEAAGGSHAVAVTADGAVQSCAGDIGQWLGQLPAGAIVLVALVDAAPGVASPVCAALAAVFPSVSSAPPEGCRVAVVAGEKGQKEPWQTMAAHDFALATVVRS